MREDIKVQLLAEDILAAFKGQLAEKLRQTNMCYQHPSGAPHGISGLSENKIEELRGQYRALLFGISDCGRYVFKDGKLIKIIGKTQRVIWSIKSEMDKLYNKCIVYHGNRFVSSQGVQ